MMETYYKLAKNCRVIAEKTDLTLLKEIADQDAKTTLVWKDFSDSIFLFEFAFNGIGINRDEYEITSFKKRVP